MLKLTYSNIEFQNFPGRTPGPPSSWGEGREGEGRGKEGGEREGKEEGEGQGREGRDRGGRGGMGEGRGARHGLRPLETSSGSAPVDSQ